MSSNSKQNRQKNSEHRKSKNQFLKEQVENTDLYKLVLNEIMTTDEECIKLNFEAPLRIH